MKGIARAAATLCVLVVGAEAQVAEAQMAQERVQSAEDREWITLSGRVESVLATGFMLDYGEDDILIEMDDFDFAEGGALMAGDRVTVTGRMDRSLYESRSIEAASVYIPRRLEYIYANPMDEEGDWMFSPDFAPGPLSQPYDDDWLSFTGRVTAVDGNAITVSDQMAEYRVDTSEAVGDEVGTTIAVGDRVLVTGKLDGADLFDKREVEADSVIKLTPLAL